MNSRAYDSRGSRSGVRLCDGARLCAARNGVAVVDASRYDVASRGVVARGVAARSVVCHGVAARSVVCHGVTARSAACHGVAAHSGAYHGVAVHSVVYRDVAVQGVVARSAVAYVLMAYANNSHDARGRTSRDVAAPGNAAYRDVPSSQPVGLALHGSYRCKRLGSCKSVENSICKEITVSFEFTRKRYNFDKSTRNIG